MAFSCTPISAADFPLDPSLGDLMHRITKQQCDSVAELMEHVSRRELDDGVWWAMAMVALGFCTLVVTLRSFK